jgi:anaerobic selenocysteine-containing dehydrogenase
LQAGEFLMMTMRSHDQFNTTIYGLDDRYRGIRNGRRVVFLHPEDISASGFAAGVRVDLISSYDGQERVASNFTIVPYDIPRRCAATYFPEANVLVPVSYFADKSHTPASKSVVISIRRAESTT